MDETEESSLSSRLAIALCYIDEQNGHIPIAKKLVRPPGHKATEKYIYGDSLNVNRFEYIKDQRFLRRLKFEIDLIL